MIASTTLGSLSQENPPEIQDAQARAGDRLRAAGLRSTPQRRAILAAFAGHVSEHLSADEVYSRAAGVLPDLGRGTVYATLAEFAEVGLLASYGTPEPVRYETNTERHAHFRCRICLRVFNVTAPLLDPDAFAREGHHVEALDLRAEGVCRECREFEEGLIAGVRAIARSGASKSLAEENASAVVVDTPLGPLLIAATDAGVARLAFPEHGDDTFLKSLVGNAGSPARRTHLEHAARQLERYFAREVSTPECTIDWNVVASAGALRATCDIPSGTQRSYHRLATGDAPKTLGRAFGANPIPIFTPCHRVTRGSLTPDTFVGGAKRRDWLLAHERH